MNSKAAPAALHYLCAAMAAYLVMGCTSTPAVLTESAEDANLTAYHTFSMMTVPVRTTPLSDGAATNTAATAGGDVVTASNADIDPMLASSPVGAAIRSDIVHSFTGRGYSESAAPDFLVAFYAGTGDIIDLKAYPYGYSGRSSTGRLNVRDYPAGTVIVDVVDAKTQRLVWRGEGVTKIPSDPDMYSRQLAVTVRDIIVQFPKAERQKS
jgi:hypothetical protein